MITTDKLLVWGAGIGGGKAVNIIADYAEQEIPDLTAYYFKELIGLLAGPAAVGIAYKLSRNPRHIKKADAIGLMGVEMFIDRIAAIGKDAAGIMQPPVRRFAPRAPPPGQRGTQRPPGHWPYSSQQRLPFQSDITW